MRVHLIVGLCTMCACMCVCVGVCIQTTEVEIEETVVVQEVSKATKPGHVTVTLSTGEPTQQEVMEQSVKAEEEVVAEEAIPSKQESISSESESEEEAEYHPNVPVSISHTQIPEEKEEEEEQEKKEEDKSEEESVLPPDAPSVPAEAEQSAEPTAQVEEESRKVDTEAEKNKTEKEGEQETEESTDDPMLTPDEAPNGLTPGEDDVTGLDVPEEDEPKVNGEASLVEERRPHFICCSEVNSSPSHLRTVPGVLIPRTKCRNPLFSFLLTTVLVFLPACVNI